MFVDFLFARNGCNPSPQGFFLSLSHSSSALSLLLYVRDHGLLECSFGASRPRG